MPSLLGQRAGMVREATGTILNIALFLAVASFITFLVLTVLGFLRWKAELMAHQEMFRADTELHDKFILQLVQFATAVGGSEASPADRKKDIDTLTDAVGDLICEVTDARNELRRFPQSPAKANAEYRSS